VAVVGGDRLAEREIRCQDGCSLLELPLVLLEDPLEDQLTRGEILLDVRARVPRVRGMHDDERRQLDQREQHDKKEHDPRRETAEAQREAERAGHFGARSP
jgi:hypothetical protein